MLQDKFIRWLDENTDYSMWHSSVKVQVVEKLMETYGPQAISNKDYSEQARATDTKDYASVYTRLDSLVILMMLHACMGITTECGELMDALKKYLIYGKPIDTVNIMEEDGDLRWYLSLLEFASGYTQDESQAKNLAKLKARYPNKFTELDALTRNLGKERQVLENATDINNHKTGEKL